MEGNTQAPQPPDDEGSITHILFNVAGGKKGASEELLQRVYDQLRSIARNRMSKERSDHTLQATALVHEAYLKISGSLEEHDWKNRAHFYSVAARAMRQILVDHARSKGRTKRGGDQMRVVIDVLDLAEDNDPEMILALDEAVASLEKFDPKLAQIVHLRFFAGLTVEETGKALEMSKRTVIRHWTFARAWLHKEIESGAGT